MSSIHRGFAFVQLLTNLAFLPSTQIIMQRIANINRLAASAVRSANRASAGFGSPVTSRLGSVRTKIDQTSVGNDPDPALKKSHDDAIRSAHGKPAAETLSEGVRFQSPA